MKQYVVDAFTDKVFSGNPAAVCVLDEPISEELMMNITKENNLFILYSIIANIGVIYSFFMIYQGIYFLAKYAKIKRKYCLYVLGIISIFIFPIIMIVLGTLQNILHLSMKINFIK